MWELGVALFSIDLNMLSAIITWHLLHFCICTEADPLQVLCSRNSTWRNSQFEVLSSN